MRDGAGNAARGADGERRAATELARLTESWTVLSRRLLSPGQPRVALDHVVIGPSGMFLVDATPRTGPVREQDGGLWQLSGDGQSVPRDLSGELTTLRGMARYMSVESETTVVPVLCLVGGRPEQFGEPRQIDGVWVVPVSRLVGWLHRLPAVVEADPGVLGRLVWRAMADYPSADAPVGAEVDEPLGDRSAARGRATRDGAIARGSAARGSTARGVAVGGSDGSLDAADEADLRSSATRATPRPRTGRAAGRPRPKTTRPGRHVPADGARRAERAWWDSGLMTSIVGVAVLLALAITSAIFLSSALSANLTAAAGRAADNAAPGAMGAVSAVVDCNRLTPTEIGTMIGRTVQPIATASGCAWGTRLDDPTTVLVTVNLSGGQAGSATQLAASAAQHRVVYGTAVDLAQRPATGLWVADGQPVGSGVEALTARADTEVVVSRAALGISDEAARTMALAVAQATNQAG